ncbi:UNVERIFIED_CONTAM: hypothetical protein Slati_1682700 [Sesamum latifolium]|uniref:Uncharacterized protein n=1 Tax=Sesamum latifolium TaxID=2727402 RepID=A0AAW2WVU2_9LAMI
MAHFHRLREFCRYTFWRSLRSKAIGRHSPGEGGVGEVQGDPFQSRKYYIEAVRKGQKRSSDETPKEAPSCKWGKDGELEKDPEASRGRPLRFNRRKSF